MDVATFAGNHIPQITAVTTLVSYGIARNKFTPAGLVAGILVSVVHMIHPWPAFFWLLTSFVFAGTLITKIGHKAKAHLTQSSTGSAGAEGARTSVQVFANSGFACILVLLHLYFLASTPYISSTLPISAGPYAPGLVRLLPIGIIAQYAAVAADTFSSELGILATSEPFLITAPWRKVAKGTNGGVTVEGLMYGALGSLLMVLVAIVSLYVSAPGVAMNATTAGVVTGVGLLGSVIDSFFGATLQATVVDEKTGKVVEGPGGQRVAVGGGRLQTGWDLLTNNGVNFAMAATTSLLAMGVAHLLDLRLSGK